jgi:23S rRNA (uracil1939-C5)-methyltransferase
MARRRAPARTPGNILVGRTVEARIERIVAGGLGLAHAVGRTLFVPGTAPGELALVRIERTPGKIAFGSIVELLERSPDRIEPPYPELTRLGADFQHLSYPAQLEAKLDIITDCLRRIGGIEPETELEIPIIPSPEEWGYRSRAEWHHDLATGNLGYIATGSHEVVDLAVDPFVVPALAETYAALRANLAGSPTEGERREIRAAAGEDGVSLEPPLLPGTEGPVSARVAGERYRYDAGCFFQAQGNSALLGSLLDEALRYTGPEHQSGSSERLAIDLYSGVGLFSLPLARRFGRVIAVESQARSATYAVENLAQAGLENARQVVMPVEDWIVDAFRSHGRASFVLVDPPRTGLPPAVIRGIERLRPSRVTYVSCDPATLARDLKALLGLGFALDGIAAFDLFPQTHHVEVVAHLRRTTIDR